MWATPPAGDQGQYPHCVGWAWWHLLQSGPLLADPATLLRPDALYREAQRVDEWPGEAYDGTSVRAGAKVLRTVGDVDGFLWALTVEDVVRHVATFGPMVVGSWWYERMSDVGPSGYAVPKGRVQGAHAYLLVGWSAERAAFRLLNSWGESWGQSGRAWLYAGALERLLDEDGEACAALVAEAA
jgi:hypothetical protein